MMRWLISLQTVKFWICIIDQYFRTRRLLYLRSRMMNRSWWWRRRGWRMRLSLMLRHLWLKFIHDIKSLTLRTHTGAKLVTVVIVLKYLTSVLKYSKLLLCTHSWQDSHSAFSQLFSKDQFFFPLQINFNFVVWCWRHPPCDWDCWRWSRNNWEQCQETRSTRREWCEAAAKRRQSRGKRGEIIRPLDPGSEIRNSCFLIVINILGTNSRWTLIKWNSNKDSCL